MSEPGMLQPPSNPEVSVIIVNYNGIHWLKKCLPSLFSVNYPKRKYEVIVVDNASQDHSVTFIQKKFPQVKLIQSSINSGFTGGNNLGVAEAKGRFIVFLNNDTEVDKEWLSTLVASAKHHPKVGIVQSKLFLATSFVTLSIKSSVLPKSALTHSTDHTPLGVLIEEVNCSDSEYQPYIWYDHGCLEPQEGDLVTRWTTGEAKICIPYVASNVKFSLVLHGYPIESNQTNQVEVKLGSYLLYKNKIDPGKIKQLTFDCSGVNEVKDTYRVVQNAGNQLLHSGLSKDRGSILRFEYSKPREFYEKDSEFFQKPALITAACGASCLIKREVIDAIGAFDGYYFMYYEDLDFSLRAWRAGWDILFEPESIVWHHHMGSTKSGNWTFFHFLIQRNHLLFVLTHYPLKVFIRYYIVMWIKAFIFSGVYFVFHFRNNIFRLVEWEERSRLQWKSVLFILREGYHFYGNRLHQAKYQRRSFEDLKQHLY